MDEAEKLDIFLNNLSLGVRSPNELMHQLIAASDADENCSPQFGTLLKDRFIKALMSEIAANRGTWHRPTLIYDLLLIAPHKHDFLKAIWQIKSRIKNWLIRST